MHVANAIMADDSSTFEVEPEKQASIIIWKMLVHDTEVQK